MVLVVKKSNVIQLHVDAFSEHGVAPKQSRSNGGKEAVYLGGLPGMTNQLTKIVQLIVKEVKCLTCVLSFRVQTPSQCPVSRLASSLSRGA